MAARIDFRSLQQLDAERAEVERKAWGRQNAPGPALATCDECGAPAHFARGDFGKPDDEVERFCSKHAPASLRRPGDYPPFR